MGQEVARPPWIAFLLGLVCPGWGHLYVDRVPRFLTAALAYLAVAITLAATSMLSEFSGMVALLCAAAALVAFSGIDAARLAPGSAARRWRRWPAFLAWWLAVACGIALWASLREPVLGYAIFRMQTDTMAPAVIRKELVLVDTRAFRARRPVLGDMVVVREPDTRRRYLRRVTGVDGTGALTLTTDRPGDGAGPERVTTDALIGRATYVLYSRAPGRTGKPVS